MSCTTDIRHCTKCGTVAIAFVGPELTLSACCGAAIVKRPCSFDHPDKYGDAIRNYGRACNDVPEPADDSSLQEPEAPSDDSMTVTTSERTGARANGSHAACTHPATPAGRRACRAARAAEAQR